MIYSSTDDFRSHKRLSVIFTVGVSFYCYSHTVYLPHRYDTILLGCIDCVLYTGLQHFW